MKLWGVSMVRNEGDVIEAFVRHNLAFLDGMAIMDHGSIDSTYEVLTRLRDEGLPLFRLRNPQKAYAQAEQVTALTRECFARTGADFVLPLDADEFLNASSRSELERAIGSVPAGTYGVQAWRSYVPTAFDRPFGQHCLQFRVRVEPYPRFKVIVDKGFMARDYEMVSFGSHRIMDTRTSRPAAHQPIDPTLLTLAHCPVRSRQQLETKVTLGYEALREAQVDASKGAHWRDLYEELSRGGAFSDARLREIAANYSVPREHARSAEGIDLVEDPVPLRRAP